MRGHVTRDSSAGDLVPALSDPRHSLHQPRNTTSAPPTTKPSSAPGGTLISVKST